LSRAFAEGEIKGNLVLEAEMRRKRYSPFRVQRGKGKETIESVCVEWERWGMNIREGPMLPGHYSQPASTSHRLPNSNFGIKGRLNQLEIGTEGREPYSPSSSRTIKYSTSRNMYILSMDREEEGSHFCFSSLWLRYGHTF
jgi:hypothetical protein